ncbi:MAG: prefoldin subunit [Candidatus Micrarchaeota archaeon]|nr:prefoldin subunit [Candidatus Micrarchaeota archaeon]
MAQSAPGEKDAEKLVKDYQTLQDQLRVSALQLDQLRVQKADLERAKAEIEKSEGKVYLSVGGVIVETTKEKANSEIGDRLAVTDARTQSINRQYTELKGKEKQLSEKITQLYKSSQGAT